MAKKPNTGKHECVEARDLIIAKRPRRRSAHLNDKLAQFRANTKPLELGQDHEPRPLENDTHTNTASKILDPDTEERPIRRSQSPSNKHTASKTLVPDAEARPIGC